ncbi:TPA: hypothetical protein ACT3KR_004074 [Raoultella planticola]
MDIIITPFNVTNNKYIDIHKELFYEMNYEVKKITQANFFKRNESVFVCNWLEDYLKGSGLTLTKNVVKFLMICIYGRIIAKKFICVRHNLKPHLNYKNEKIYRCGLKFLEAISDRIIYHGLYEINPIYEYVPHPLYDQELVLSDNLREIEYAFYGAISRYKGLVELLNEWPATHKLLIKGACNDKNLMSDIESVIKQRKLENVVKVEYGFIQDEELNTLMKKTRYLILPHEEDSMIVSGAFYHGISYGANIIARSGRFSNSVSDIFEFCTSYEPGKIETALSRLTYVQPSEVKKVAISLFGKEICKKTWFSMLN